MPPCTPAGLHIFTKSSVGVVKTFVSRRHVALVAFRVTFVPCLPAVCQPLLCSVHVCILLRLPHAKTLNTFRSCPPSECHGERVASFTVTGGTNCVLRCVCVRCCCIRAPASCPAVLERQRLRVSCLLSYVERNKKGVLWACFVRQKACLLNPVCFASPGCCTHAIVHHMTPIARGRVMFFCRAAGLIILPCVKSVFVAGSFKKKMPAQKPSFVDPHPTPIRLSAGAFKCVEVIRVSVCVRLLMVAALQMMPEPPHLALVFVLILLRREKQECLKAAYCNGVDAGCPHSQPDDGAPCTSANCNAGESKVCSGGTCVCGKQPPPECSTNTDCT